ncbi:hypothetical protein FDI40_gp467 [Agrobacterium phage Atu_ph07]|uniref:Uncharacterized protein n=1 Tax=Agrobacterium phage Atu_ph07 TaxID=2024264 RepID=A0A2L0V0C8_9CAUD|nr:hypothetical protein FDI40_gp467 [Agrobacterium phage Atu_ph07]AUZ95226.1 hypothetical protein [Agrobacterium phage Atu_ph07]
MRDYGSHAYLLCFYELGNSVVGGVGFEPTWLNTTDLQSVPIDRSGNHQG